MSTSIILQSATYQLDLLDAAAHAILDPADLGMPNVERFFAKPFGRGFDPLGGYRTGNHDMTLPIMLGGSSVDNLIQNIQQVRAVLHEARRFHVGLGGAPAVLMIQPNGATNTTVFDIMDGELEDGQILSRGLGANRVYNAILHLTCRPFGRTQQLRKSTSGTLNNGGGAGASGGTYTLTRPTSGEIPGPALVEIQTAAGDTWQRLILAKVSRANVADIAGYFILQCETTAGTGYTVTDIHTGQPDGTDVAVAAASGGNVRRYTNNGGGAVSHTQNYLRWELTGPLASIVGKYDIWLHINEDAAQDIDSVQLKYGGTNGLLISNAAVSTGTVADGMYYLGQIEIPTPGADGGVVNSFLMVLALTVSFPGAGGAFDLDNLFVIRVSPGVQMLDVEFASATAAQNILVVDRVGVGRPNWQPRTYLLDSSGNYKLLARGSPWLDQGFSRSVDNDDLYLPLLLGKSGNVYTIDLSHQFTIAVSDFPLFGSFDA